MKLEPKNYVELSRIEESIYGAIGEALISILDGDQNHSTLVSLERPKNENHGEYSTSIALKLAKVAKKAPRVLAESLVQNLKAASSLEGIVSDIKIEGPGFINFFLTQNAFLSTLYEIHDKEELYGSHSISNDEKFLVEYVSANPTGPLTIAHGRQAALGDSLVRILKFAGFNAESEYYNNDIGVQIQTLGISLFMRCREVSGEKVDFPENGYQGEYLVSMAKDIVGERGSEWLGDEKEATNFCQEYAKEKIFGGIKKDLDDFGVSFDTFYSQKTLETSGQVESIFDALKEKGFVYESEGAWWLKSTEFGDDKDRVLIKSDGTRTYLTPDIAYHDDKFNRGFTCLINILGPDHHGYIARLKASQQALGHNPEKVHVLIAQLVSLYEGDKQLKMSTRAGEFITLRQLIDEVGVDAARFFFLNRKFDSHLDFDLELAKSQTSDNPVFYIQYAHARVCSIRRSCEEKGVVVDQDEYVLEHLSSLEEIRLIRQLRLFPKVILASAEQKDPHILVEYLHNCAALFHQFYQKKKVAVDEVEVASARMFLIEAMQIVIRNGLKLLGVSSPKSM